jgi:hypothetical protein
MRPKLTFASVASIAGLIIAVGGASVFVAAQLAENSVGAGHLKKNAVSTAKINTAQTTNAAQTANTAAQSEPWNEVGTPGEPQFGEGWADGGPSVPSVAFYKDPTGVVHLKGWADNDFDPHQRIFTLPPGFRPVKLVGSIQELGGELVEVTINEAGEVRFRGETLPVHLDGITFRAEV